MAAVEPYFPEEWIDDDRMNFMFSAFPEHRNVNPKHWDSKLQFWRKIIVESCKCHNELCVDFHVLRRRFSRNGLFPLGLGTVLAEMLRTGEFESIENVTNTPNNGWVSWGFDIAKRTVSWTIDNFISGSDMTKLVERGLVMVAVDRLKEQAQLILETHAKSVEHEATDYIVPWIVLKSRCQRKGIMLSDKDLDIVICHLQRNRTVVVHTTPDEEKVVKFVNKNESKVSFVNEKDLGILRLKKTIASLTLQADKLSKNSECCVQKAKELSNKGLKKPALAQLRKKAVLQKTMDRTYDNLHTLEELLHRIQQANTDKMILDTLKAGSSALKAIQEGLSAKEVDKVMLDLEETLDDAEDIQEALEQGNRSIDERAQANMGYDNKALEKQLAELSLDTGHEAIDPRDLKVQFSDSETADKSQDLNLPEPPSSSPSNSQSAATKPKETVCL